jgi:hypothetical protein
MSDPTPLLPPGLLGAAWTAILSILAAALLFTLFGLLRPRTGCGGCGGASRCGGCPHAEEHDA